MSSKIYADPVMTFPLAEAVQDNSFVSIDPITGKIKPAAKRKRPDAPLVIGYVARGGDPDNPLKPSEVAVLVGEGIVEARLAEGETIPETGVYGKPVTVVADGAVKLAKGAAGGIDIYPDLVGMCVGTRGNRLKVLTHQNNVVLVSQPTG